jgi:hypothetical protein
VLDGGEPLVEQMIEPGHGRRLGDPVLGIHRGSPSRASDAQSGVTMVDRTYGGHRLTLDFVADRGSVPDRWHIPIAAAPFTRNGPGTVGQGHDRRVGGIRRDVATSCYRYVRGSGRRRYHRPGDHAVVPASARFRLDPAGAGRACQHVISRP